MEKNKPESAEIKNKNFEYGTGGRRQKRPFKTGFYKN